MKYIITVPQLHNPGSILDRRLLDLLEVMSKLHLFIFSKLQSHSDTTACCKIKQFHTNIYISSAHCLANKQTVST